jgi:ABC-type antimicrobial peptide transport system permease subunit
MALGAQLADVLGLIMREGMLLTSIGLIAGLTAALATTHLLRSFLYEISPADPLTFVGLALLLTVVALLACWLPAARAARVEPMAALRTE